MVKRHWSRRNWLALLIVVSAVMLMIDLLVSYQPSSFELAILHVTGIYRTPWLTVLMQGVSGSVFWVCCVMGGWAAMELWRERWLDGLCLAGALASLLLIEPFKWALHRPRPAVEALLHIGQAPGFGFPSGHSQSVVVVVGVGLLVLLGRAGWSTTWRKTAMAVGVGYILLVGWSRMYLDAHYPSDVLGGYTIGLVVVWIIATVRYYISATKLAERR